MSGEKQFVEVPIRVQNTLQSSQRCCLT